MLHNQCSSIYEQTEFVKEFMNNSFEQLLFVKNIQNSYESVLFSECSLNQSDKWLNLQVTIIIQR